MAKSKAQKQAEAIDRKRALFSINFDHYIKNQSGTAAYLEMERLRGTAHAESLAATTKGTFERYCAEAQIDKHGNPL